MKLKSKIAASLIAACLITASMPLSSFAEGGTGTGQQQTTNAPALSSGAFSGGYSSSSDKIVKSETGYTITTVTYIPIDNFDNTVTTDSFDVKNIFAIASADVPRFRNGTPCSAA